MIPFYKLNKHCGLERPYFRWNLLGTGSLGNRESERERELGWERGREGGREIGRER